VSQPGPASGVEKPNPGSDGATTTWKASAGSPPWRAGLVSGPMMLMNSTTDPGHVSRSISSAPYRYQARIRLHLSASAAAERLPPTVGHLQADGEQACILHTAAQSADALAIYVAILGAEFEILHPPGLAAQILALAGRLTRAARH
jgi:WYL domain